MTEDRIAAELGRVAGLLQAMNERMDRDRADAKAHRDETAARLKALGDRQATLTTADTLRDMRIEHIETRLGEAEKIGAVVRGWRAQWAGALIVLGVIGSLATGALALFWKKLAQLIGLS